MESITNVYKWTTLVVTGCLVITFIALHNQNNLTNDLQAKLDLATQEVRELQTQNLTLIDDNISLAGSALRVTATTGCKFEYAEVLEDVFKSLDLEYSVHQKIRRRNEGDTEQTSVSVQYIDQWLEVTGDYDTNTSPYKVRLE